MTQAVVDIETIPLRPAECVEEDDVRKASLDALSGRIACIGVILVDSFRIQSRSAFVSDDEPEMLRRFWRFLLQNRTGRFITHNGLNFDLPFLWRRSVINQVKPPIDLDLRRYRKEPVFDTMTVWSNWDPRGLISLDTLARGLGYEGKLGNGSQIAELWKRGAHREIATYCLHDCWLTYACYCRMNFTDPDRPNTDPMVHLWKLPESNPNELHVATKPIEQVLETCST